MNMIIIFGKGENIYIYGMYDDYGMYARARLYLLRGRKYIYMACIMNMTNFWRGRNVYINECTRIDYDHEYVA